MKSVKGQKTQNRQQKKGGSKAKVTISLQKRGRAPAESGVAKKLKECEKPSRDRCTKLNPKGRRTKWRGVAPMVNFTTDGGWENRDPKQKKLHATESGGGGGGAKAKVLKENSWELRKWDSCEANTEGGRRTETTSVEIEKIPPPAEGD